MKISVVEYKLDSSVKERFRANPEVFSQVLRSWGISEQLIKTMEIVVEVRDMIQDGGFGGRNGNCFIFYLHVDLFRDLAELNATIAHELKHLWYLVMMPSEKMLEREGGFWINRRRHPWEEKECRRMEKKYASTLFIGPCEI